ncbi:MAG: phosphoenolpyruvate carboxylase [Pseudomonadota bacterium]|nr:phosphoenolpyruvate carboxylase [Pseudomonadota bacterium]
MPLKKQNSSIQKYVRQNIQFAQKDEALRADVHALGEMIGEMLLEQGGETLYKHVESVRQLAIGRRANNLDDQNKLDLLLKKMSTSAARDVVRAFSTYFQIVNTAEQVHRIRRRRDYLRDRNRRQYRSLDETIFQLHDSGFSLKSLSSLLNKIVIESVFTRHPTEITRRTILRKQQNIAHHVANLKNPELTPLELDACMENIRSEITAIWQTEEIPEKGTTVFDELEHILFFLTDVIYEVIPSFYQQLEKAFVDIYGEDERLFEIPTMIRFSSWIGGDMAATDDMSSRIIRGTLERQRSLILDLYYQDCLKLAEKLSQSSNRIQVDDNVFGLINKYSRQFPEHLGSISQRYRNMPYRLLLRFISQRLQETYDDGAFPYESDKDFVNDLELIEKSLAARKGANAGLKEVKKLIRKVKTFGFHFLTLDVRQNASELQQAVGYCLNDNKWQSEKRSYRLKKLRYMLEKNASPIIEPNNDAKRLIAIFQTISYCRRKFGPNAIGVFLVRHCQGVDDVLAALLIAKWADMNDSNGNVTIDVAPEFDTNQELRQAGELLTELIGDPFYQKNIAARAMRQTVMLSNAESAKDCSTALARWRMQQAHNQLNLIFSNADIDYTLFHGRGSLSGRSGFSDGIACGHLRIMEYGEATNDRYGIQGIALRSLEKSFSMVTTATANLENLVSPKKTWTSIMDQIGSDSDDIYQELINGKENFSKYFRRVTPIDVIELKRISSKNDSKISDISWVFAWAQSRFLLPQWFGIGTALEKAILEKGIESIREMSTQWAFFTRLIDDVEVALAIADIDIAELYSALAGEHLHHHFFPLIKNEYNLSVKNILKLRNKENLLGQNLNLKRSIILRNPYVDPISLLQIELLRRWRSGGRKENKLQTALIASVNGISRGLQSPV